MSDDVMNSIRDSFKRTNLIESLEYTPEYEYHNIALIIESAEKSCTTDTNFSGVKNYFLQRFISNNTATSDFNMSSRDFFKGIVYVDYLCNRLLSSCEFLQQFRGNSLPDMVDASINYFPSLSRRRTTSTENLPTLPNLRYISLNSRLASDIIVKMTLNSSVKESYKKAINIHDLKAGLFIDTIAQVKTLPTSILISEEGFYKASLQAYAEIYKTQTERIIQRMGV